MATVGSMIRPLRGADRSFSQGPMWKRLTRSAAPAVAGYLLVRLIGIGILWIWAEAGDQSLLGMLGDKHDAVWYVQIIEHGYDHGESAQSNMAFFPLYPMLARALAVATPLGSMGAARVLAWLAGIAAAWGLYVLGNHLHDRRTGIMLAILWVSSPTRWSSPWPIARACSPPWPYGACTRCSPSVG